MAESPGGGPDGGSPSGAQPPDDTASVTSGAPPRAAGGLAALSATAAHLNANRALLRGTRALAALNQHHGFDCPGCAWPEPHEHRSDFEFCENGAKAVAWEATSRRADAAFFARHSIAELAAQSDHWLGQQGRLSEPLVRRPGDSHYQPITWDQAFDLLAAELLALPDPDQAVFYTSGRTSNEAAFLYQLFVRQYGTNNLPDCSDMCHESSGVALRETIGVGKGTVQLDDFEQADAIFILGQNPGTNHPRMLTTLQQAARRGCRIVSINPLAEVALSRFRHPQNPLEMLGPGTPIACLHLPVRIGGDIALLKGIAKAMLELERQRATSVPVVDRAFVEQYTEGFAELADHLAAEPWSVLEEESGIDRSRMEQAAEIAASSRRLIACWAMGLTQHRHAVAGIQQVVNLLLLGGHFGRPGAGACPVRGHSNVQGDRTMGIFEHVDGPFLDRLEAHFGFRAPRRPGLDTVAAIAALEAGRAGVFVALGGNFLAATPDTERTAAALTRCRLTAHVSTKLNRSHLITGQQALILPCLGRSERDQQAGGEQFVTVEDSMSLVHRSQGVLDPASPQLRSEVSIVTGLARAVLGPRGGVDWTALAGDYDRIRDHIAAVIPGFQDFNARVRGHNSAGFGLPNAARQRQFPTASGRARFTVFPTPRTTLADGELVMMTIRSHDQFNTTIYGLDDRYRGIHGGRRVVLVHRDDLAALGVQPGQVVDLESHFQGQVRRAPRFVAVAYDIPRRCAATYFPEANVLVPLDSLADKSRTPTSKSVIITLRKAAD